MSQVVLVVEEDLADQLLIARTVAELGDQVKLVTVVTGGDALDYCLKRGPYVWRKESEAPSVMVTDHNLPDMRASDIARALREFEGLDLPMIVYAGELNGDARAYDHLEIARLILRDGNAEEFQAALLAELQLRIQD